MLILFVLHLFSQQKYGFVKFGGFRRKLMELELITLLVVCVFLTGCSTQAQTSITRLLAARRLKRRKPRLSRQRPNPPA